MLWRLGVQWPSGRSWSSSCVQQLYLNDNILEDDAVQAALDPNLARLTAIQALHLSCFKMDINGVRWLGPRLAQLKSIQKLDLVCTNACPDGAKSLFPLLAHFIPIHQLRLGGREIGGQEIGGRGNHVVGAPPTPFHGNS